MKTEKALVIGIILGLALCSIVVLRDFDLIYGGIISAILVGMVIGRLADTNPVRCTINSIFACNLIFWAIIALFDPDAMIVLEFGNKMVVAVLIGFILTTIVLYSIIGSFSAFVARKMSHRRSDHGGYTR